MNWKYVGFILAIFVCQARTIHSQCLQVNASSGTISDSYITNGYVIHEKCWKIAIAAHHSVNATVELLQFSTKLKRNCDMSYVQLKMDNVGIKMYCGFDNIRNDTLFSSGKDSNLELLFTVNSGWYANGVELSFQLKYFITPTILGINGINEVRENSINWLKTRHNPFWGWKEDTPRAVIALYLSGAAQFNGTVIEETMAKQAELRTALSLTWNSVSIERLSTFINALLAICLKPRHFYGHDLVTQLRMQVESSEDIPHPAAYLALCNANETWPIRAKTDLLHVLIGWSNDTFIDYRFVRDLQAFAIMALSCDYNRRNTSGEIEDDSLGPLYLDVIKRMKEHQQSDGSFGNPHTTALFTQALIASNQETAMDWRVNKNIEYLMKEVNATDVNFLTVYAILPLLNRKTLADIAHINCTTNPRFEGEDLQSELEDNQGPKIRVEYFLYIGDQKDVIHSISLRVPRNSSAFQVMEFAALKDKKYKFKVETVDTIKHVYEIAGIPNDPEEGKFWFLYVKPKNSGLTHLTSNSEKLILEDEEHLVMWYETQKMYM